MPTALDHVTAELPDPESARRFLASLAELHPRDAAKLQKNDGLLSDVMTLVSYSPLLATTMLQNPDYLSWLNRKRRAPAVRTKDELLEALGRFVLTHSQLDLHTQLARFRRRELLRIFLADIRRLATIAEITEDISNLADAILETALRSARQQMDNRFGAPQAVDEKGRKHAAEFCIVSLGKLGSKELNYSSDIDLLFLYSAEGETSGRGTRGSITNREYFIKLGEAIAQIVGKQAGEGAAYRVDMRLRPHGRVGPLAISVDDAVRYYTNEARDWERQVLIRSRASAGDPELFKHFFQQVETKVFMVSEPDQDAATQNPRSKIQNRLEGVRRSKQLIDADLRSERGFNVKLGRGGIREIEFIAQALQLAYGGDDRWLRVPHTLISLSRLSDRGLVTEAELTELYNAYEFLRRLEHVLQMENGLQTHSVPDDPQRRALIARRMRSGTLEGFNSEIEHHTSNVHRVFVRIFDVESTDVADRADEWPVADLPPVPADPIPANEPSADAGLWTRERFYSELTSAVASAADFRHQLGVFRRSWSAVIDEIRRAELDGAIELKRSKRAQTALAEASIDVALDITRTELKKKFSGKLQSLPIAVMGLGKLGGGSIDYGSDLDLVLVYDQEEPVPKNTTAGEFYSEAAQTLVTTLSSMTRDGSIYRVDLRLRPYGKNGTSTISAAAFADYMRETADIWEWLAYVKIRGVAGEIELAKRVENELRQTIFDRASRADASQLASETHRMRMMLEKEKARTRRSKEIDIKYGPGGLLDIYFAMRYLQLRDNVPDAVDDRSTENMLRLLADKGSLTASEYEPMLAGYRFLSTLDHELRLTVGRTTRLPEANIRALGSIADRMGFGSVDRLVEQLTLHRLNIRAVFDEVTALRGS